MSKIIKVILKNKTAFITILFSFIYSIAFSLIAVNRFWQFDIFYYDFGIFDMAIWKAAHFQVPTIEHLILGGKIIFADHFNPSIFILSPIYWITDRSEAILIAQNFIVGLSAIVLFFTGLKYTKNNFFSFFITISYLLFNGIQNALISDFHEATIATLPLIFCFFSYVYKKKLLLFLSLIIFLGCKESNFATGAAIGITLFIIDKKNIKLSLIVIFTSVLWGIISIKFIIPFFSGGQYLYSTPVPTNPVNFISSFFNNQTKVDTITNSLLSFGLLPLFSFSFYPMIIVDFASRFYPSFLTASWGMGFHYSAMTGAILAISSIFSYKFLNRFINKKFLSAWGFIVVLISLYFYRFIFNSPLSLSFNPTFYNHTKDLEFLAKLVSVVPKGASVATHNNLAAHFTHSNLRLLRDETSYKEFKPEYIVLDTRDGQNANNYYGTSVDLKKILDAVKKDKNYVIFYKTDNQFVFKRISQ